MARTPAATRARIKVQHPEFRIRTDSRTGDRVAVRFDGRGRVVRARTDLLLEAALNRADNLGQPFVRPLRRR